MSSQIPSASFSAPLLKAILSRRHKEDARSRCNILTAQSRCDVPTAGPWCDVPTHTQRPIWCTYTATSVWYTCNETLVRYTYTETPGGGSQTHSPVERLAYILSLVRGSIISTHSHLKQTAKYWGSEILRQRITETANHRDSESPRQRSEIKSNCLLSHRQLSSCSNENVWGFSPQAVDYLSQSQCSGSVIVRNNPRSSFSQWVCSRTRTGTQDVAILCSSHWALPTFLPLGCSHACVHIFPSQIIDCERM